jgi:hypothetical protein
VDPRRQKETTVVKELMPNVKHKRLNNKTKWIDTKYGSPKVELLTRAKAQGLKRKVAAAASEQTCLDSAAESRACTGTHAHIEVVSSMIDNSTASEPEAGGKQQGADSRNPY